MICGSTSTRTTNVPRLLQVGSCSEILTLASSTRQLTPGIRNRGYASFRTSTLHSRTTQQGISAISTMLMLITKTHHMRFAWRLHWENSNGYARLARMPSTPLTMCPSTIRQGNISVVRCREQAGVTKTKDSKKVAWILFYNWDWSRNRWPKKRRLWLKDSRLLHLQVIRRLRSARASTMMMNHSEPCHFHWRLVELTEVLFTREVTEMINPFFLEDISYWLLS